MLRLALVAAFAALIAAPSAAAWTWPSDGPVHREFVLVANPYAGGQHRGIDVGGAPGAAVAAPAGGTVSFVGTVGANGRTVTIQTADGYAVTLTHLGTATVLRGVVVAEGAPVGTIGPSGTPEVDVPYVHLGVRLAADADAYVDPLALLPARGALEAPAPPAPAGPESPVEALAVAPEQQRPSIAAVRELPDAGAPFDAPEPPAAPAVSVPAPEAAAAAPAPVPEEAAASAPPAEEEPQHGDLLVKERYALPVVAATPRAASPQSRPAPATASARAPWTAPRDRTLQPLRAGSPAAARSPRADRQTRPSALPGARVPVPTRGALRDARRPPVAAPFAPHDAAPVAVAVARSRRGLPLAELLVAVLSAAAVALARARVVGDAARRLRRRDVLRDNADLLRERDAEHRQRVYDGGRRRVHPASTPARGGDVLPHRRRRALDEGVPRRAGAGTRAVRVPGADRGSLERAA